MASSYPTLRQIQGLPDPVSSWMWSCTIALPGETVIPGPYIMDVSFPFSYIEPLNRYRAGSYLYFPGRSNIDPTSITFYETEDFRVLQALKMWQGQVIDSSGNYNAPVKFLGTITLHLYDNQGNERANCNLFGCWPARLTDWSLNYQNSSHLQVAVQFSVNNSQFTFTDKTGATVLSSIGFNNPAQLAAPIRPLIRQVR